MPPYRKRIDGVKKFCSLKTQTRQRGIGNSIRTGLQESLAAYPNLDAVILLTCDQPLVDREIIIGLKTKREETKKPIIAPRYASMLSIPALFGRANFDELLFLDNEAGAKKYHLRSYHGYRRDIRLMMARSTSTRRRIMSVSFIVAIRLQVFLPLIGLQDIRAFRFSAANVIEIQRVSAQAFRSITSRKKDSIHGTKSEPRQINLPGLERRAR